MLTPVQQVKFTLRDTDSTVKRTIVNIPSIQSSTFERIFTDELSVGMQVAALKGWRRFGRAHDFANLDGDLKFLREVAGVTEGSILGLEQEFSKVALAVSLRLRQSFSERIEKVVLFGQSQGLSAKQIANKIDNRKVTELVVRDQINIAYRVGVESAIQEVSGAVVNQEFIAVLDDRVRAEHLVRHGTVLPRNHPWWTFNTPPLEFNCRCTVVYNFTPTTNNTEPPPSLVGVTKPDKSGNIRIVGTNDERADRVETTRIKNSFGINFRSLTARLESDNG